jgi:hypothetical protein
MSRALLAMLENEGDDAPLFTKKYIYTMLVMLAARKIFARFFANPNPNPNPNYIKMMKLIA